MNENALGSLGVQKVGENTEPIAVTISALTFDEYGFDSLPPEFTDLPDPAECECAVCDCVCVCVCVGVCVNECDD